NMKEQPVKTKNTLLIIGLIVGMFFGALDNTIVGTAMPRIIGDLGGLDRITWVTTAYMLSATSVVLIAGKLADILGRKVVYVTGIILFIIGSALCGTSDTMNQLILYRGLQGIGGGIMMPMAMIIIGDIFTGAQRAKWQGAFGGIFGLASVIGPQVGGWVVDSLNWHWVFYINLPVGVAALALISLGLKSHRVTGPVRIDFGGMVTMIGFVVYSLLALTLGGKNYAWTSWQIVGLSGLSLICLAAFTLIESRAKEPLLPLHLFKNKTFTLMNGIGFLMSVGMFGAIMFVPLFMQGVIGISASSSGTVMTPMMITMVLASISGGQLVRKIGVRAQVIMGMIIMAGGFGLLSTMGLETSKLMASSYMIVIGFGMGLVMPILTIALQESFPKAELGIVTSSSQFFRQIGGVFGMSALGVIMNNHSSKLLSEQLAPALQKFPPGFQPIIQQVDSQISKDPQGLYSMLLSPRALENIPQIIQVKLMPILKITLVDSLHIVYLYALAFILLGLALAPFLGRIKISDPKVKRVSIEKAETA
ncbi:MAG: MDR family MFS transporter, partial [Desulfocucumaceae bacterium]